MFSKLDTWRVELLTTSRQRRSAASTASTLAVVKAEYGADTTWIDVRKSLTRKISAGRLELTVTNEEMGGDPLVGVGKELRLIYTVDGKRLELTTTEGQVLSIP